MLDSEALQVTLLVTDVLDSLEIPYVIGGSVASIFHGMVRTTMDADILANIETKHVAPFVTAMQNQFYIDEQSLIQAIERRSSVNLIHLETMFKVDILCQRNGRLTNNSSSAASLKDSKLTLIKRFGCLAPKM